jgi:cytochrome c biogenesis protein CcmG/thiol:disulfide interchange protein DsbE
VPCRVEHPELVEFERRHAQEGDAGIVSVAFDDQPDAIRSFFAAEGGTWPVLATDTGGIALDYGVRGVPESYLIAPSGQVAAKFFGVTADELDATIDRLSAEAGGEPAEASTGPVEAP